MQIEFNPSRLGIASATQPANQTGAPASATDSASLGSADALKTAINSIPLVRPDKVDAAKAQVANSQFPPDEMLKAVSSLIADNL